MTEEIKRFEFFAEHLGECVRAGTKPADDGEWVRYFDHQHFLAAAVEQAKAAPTPEQPEEPTCKSCGGSETALRQGNGEWVSEPCPDCTQQGPTCGGSGEIVLKAAPGWRAEFADCPGCKDCTQQEAEGEEEWVAGLRGDVGIRVMELLERAALESAPPECQSESESDPEFCWLRGRDDTFALVREEVDGYIRRAFEEFDWPERDSRLTKEAVKSLVEEQIRHCREATANYPQGSHGAAAAIYKRRGFEHLMTVYDAAFGEEGSDAS